MDGISLDPINLSFDLDLDMDLDDGLGDLGIADVEMSSGGSNGEDGDGTEGGEVSDAQELAGMRLGWCAAVDLTMMC